MTIVIPLTKGKVAIVDDCDADLGQHKWHFSGRYAMRFVEGSTSMYGKRVRILMHRAIVERMIGRSLGKFERVDHVDNDGCLNTRGNLRVCTPQENNRNRVVNANNVSGYKGVSRNSTGGNYNASICVNGKDIYLGTFKSAIDAASAYDQAARRYFGEFARCNFPNADMPQILKVSRYSVESSIFATGQNVEEFLSEMVKSNLAVAKIAKVLGVSGGSIHTLLRKHGYIYTGTTNNGYWTRATETEATE